MTDRDDVESFVRRHVAPVPPAEPGHEARMRARLAERRESKLQRATLVLGLACSVALVTLAHGPSRGSVRRPVAVQDARAAAILADSFAAVDEASTDGDDVYDGWAP
jgi:hypothetical protein